MPKRRPPTNLDDTDAVDGYLARLAHDANVSKHSSIRRHHEGTPAAELRAKATAEVAMAVANLERGDCPHPIERMWLLVTSDHFGLPGTVQLVAEVCHPILCCGWPLDDADNAQARGAVRFHAFDGSADALTLKCLGDDGYLQGAAEKLGVDVVREMDSELGGEVAGAALDLAVEEAWDTESLGEPGEVARLKSLFSVWLDKTRWGQTFIHGLNRPSSGSWSGYPWEANFIMDHRGCGLRRGLPRSSVVEINHVMCTTPEKMAAETRYTKPEAFVQVWSWSWLKAEHRGESLSPADAVEASLAVWQATLDERRLQEQDAKKKPKAESRGTRTRAAARVE